MFMLLVELGYVFGIVHKLLNDCNWVIWMYIVLFLVVAVDIALYFRNRRFDLAASRASAPALAAALLLLVPTVADAAPADWKNRILMQRDLMMKAKLCNLDSALALFFKHLPDEARPKVPNDGLEAVFASARLRKALGRS